VSAGRGESVASEQGRGASRRAGAKPAGRAASANSASARSSAAKTSAAKTAATKSSTRSTTAKSTATRSTAAKRASAARASTVADEVAETTAAEPAKPAAKRTTSARKPAASSGAAKRSASDAAAKRASAKSGSAKSGPATSASTSRSAEAAGPPTEGSTPADRTDAPAETGESAQKRAAVARNESASASAAKGKTAKSARAASTAAARARAAEARKAAASARERVAASVTTDTTEAEPRSRRATGPVDAVIAAPEPAEPTAPENAADVLAEPTPDAAPAVHDVAGTTGDDEAADVVRAAEVTRTWHPGGPDETPATSADPAEADVVADDDAADDDSAVAAERGPEPEADDRDDATTGVAAEPSADTPVGTVLTGEAILLVGADPDAAATGDDVVAEDADALEAAAPEVGPAADTDDHEGERGVAVIPLGVVTATPSPRKKRTIRVAREAPAPEAPIVLSIDGLVKRFGDTTAVDAISLGIRAGSFYGIVGPNGAGKTTTLSMITGLLRPDGGSVHVNGIDVWKEPRAAKRITGVLPDRLRLFDRLTGAEMLYYAGSLRGLDHRTVLDRSADLADAFGLDDALDRLVADYSAGMTKKIALACAMIHSPRMLVLDEPFESVDPVSAANLTDILERYVAGGGTVLLSSHSMDLIERVCDSAAIIVGGRVLASGTLDEVRRGDTLEDRFVELAGGRKAAEGMEWLHSFSD